MQRKCDNCVFFRWNQPEDMSTIKQCVRCKSATYCSRQCQQEHWHNVHKKHCKYIAGVKVLPMSKHEEASCLVCKKEAETGKWEVSKSSNPVLPCLLSLHNQEVLDIYMETDMLAFPLAETTGRFMTKTEATITVMMRILLKLTVAKGSV